MFFQGNGKLVFKFGKDNYEKAKEQASTCKEFILDKDEDELVTCTKENSCYNCLFRRWTQESFVCLKG